MRTYFLDVLFHHYADFSGRATRKQWWLFLLWSFIIAFVVAMVFIFLPLIAYWFIILFFLVLTIPNISIFVRRVRDTGHSPYWGLLMLPYAITAVAGVLPRSLNEYQILVSILSLANWLSFFCGIGVLIFALLPSKK